MFACHVSAKLNWQIKAKLYLLDVYLSGSSACLAGTDSWVLPTEANLKLNKFLLCAHVQSHHLYDRSRWSEVQGHL